MSSYVFATEIITDSRLYNTNMRSFYKYIENPVHDYIQGIPVTITSVEVEDGKNTIRKFKIQCPSTLIREKNGKYRIIDGKKNGYKIDTIYITAKKFYSDDKCYSIRDTTQYDEKCWNVTKIKNITVRFTVDKGLFLISVPEFLVENNKLIHGRFRKNKIEEANKEANKFQDCEQTLYRKVRFFIDAQK